MRSLASAPLPTSSLPDRTTLEVSADLTSPDLVLLPVVLKNCYCLSIVQGKLWSGKLGRKFNVDAIAEEKRKIKIEADGPTKTRGVDGPAGADVVMDVDGARETAPEP